MLTQEDKKWVVETLTEALANERLVTNQQFADMRDFIIDGRKQDRAWMKGELEEFARIVAVGFTEVDKRFKPLERRQSWT